MIGVRSSPSPIRLRPVLARLVSGSLMLLVLLPVGLSGQETQQVTLYTSDGGSQQRLISTPLVVDVGLPSPMEAPVSAVIGTGTGTRLTEVEVVVRDSAGGQLTPSYAKGGVRVLAADMSGNVWVGTSTGLSRFDGQQWMTFTYDHIRSLAVDGQGQVWVGSWGDVTRFDGQRWTCYKGLFGDRIAVAPNGDVWCTGYGGSLLRFDGQAWWTYDHADMGVVDSEPWWTYAIDLLARFGEEGWWWKEANLTRGFRSVHVTDIAVDRSGTLWAVLEFYKPRGTSGEYIWSSLLSFDGTRWTSYLGSFGMIVSDSQGRVWLDRGVLSVQDGWTIGLCFKEGSTWKYYKSLRFVYHRFYWGAAGGPPWVVRGDYFGMLEGTTWTRFSWEEFDPPHAPVFDSRGDLWIPSRDGLYRWHRPDLPTAIASSSMSGAPHSFHLAQNYPNPFNHATHIGFTLQQPSAVSLQVFNTHGQLVATLVEGIRSAGTYQMAWDGRDAHGQVVSSGVYIVRLDAEGRQATRKMLLIQ